jgi:hypothetical protein
MSFQISILAIHEQETIYLSAAFDRLPIRQRMPELTQVVVPGAGRC